MEARRQRPERRPIDAAPACRLWALARAEIRIASVMPPQIARSGWKMSTAPSIARSRKSWRVNSLSPAAIGMSVAARTCGATRLVVGGHRLLEPGQVAVLDEPAEALGLGDREGPVGVAHQPAIGAERGARRDDPPRRMAGIGVDDADPHLDRAETALLDIAEQLLADLVRPAQPPEA